MNRINLTAAQTAALAAFATAEAKGQHGAVIGYGWYQGVCKQGTLYALIRRNLIVCDKSGAGTVCRLA